MTSDHSPEAIAKRVRTARQAADLSQDELGKKLGLTKVAYGDYERVKRLFDTDQLFRLESVLGRPVGWFLGLPSDLTDDEQHLLGMYRRAKEIGDGDMVLGALKGMMREK